MDHAKLTKFTCYTPDPTAKRPLDLQVTNTNTGGAFYFPSQTNLATPLLEVSPIFYFPQTFFFPSPSPSSSSSENFAPLPASFFNQPYHSVGPFLSPSLPTLRFIPTSKSFFVPVSSLSQYPRASVATPIQQPPMSETHDPRTAYCTPRYYTPTEGCIPSIYKENPQVCQFQMPLEERSRASSYGGSFAQSNPNTPTGCSLATTPTSQRPGGCFPVTRPLGFHTPQYLEYTGIRTPGTPTDYHDVLDGHSPPSEVSTYPHQRLNKADYMDCLDVENGVHLLPQPYSAEYDAELSDVQQRAAAFHRQKAKDIHDLTIQLHLASVGLRAQSEEIESLRDRVETLEDLSEMQHEADALRDATIGSLGDRLDKDERKSQVRVYNYQGSFQNGFSAPIERVAREILEIIGLGDIQSFHIFATRPSGANDKRFMLGHPDYRPLLVLEFSSENLARYVLHRFDLWHKAGGVGFSMEMDPTIHHWTYPDEEIDANYVLEDSNERATPDTHSQPFENQIRSAIPVSVDAGIGNSEFPPLPTTLRSPSDKIIARGDSFSPVLDGLDEIVSIFQGKQPSYADVISASLKSDKKESSMPATSRTKSSSFGGLNIGGIPEFIPRTASMHQLERNAAPDLLYNKTPPVATRQKPELPPIITNLTASSALKTEPSTPTISKNTNMEFNLLLRGDKTVVVPIPALQVEVPSPERDGFGKTISSALDNVAARYDIEAEEKPFPTLVTPVTRREPAPSISVVYEESTLSTGMNLNDMLNNFDSFLSKPLESVKPTLRSPSRQECVAFLSEKGKQRAEAASQKASIFSDSTEVMARPHLPMDEISSSDSECEGFGSPYSTLSSGEISCPSSAESTTGGSPVPSHTGSDEASDDGWKVVKHKRRF